MPPDGTLRRNKRYVEIAAVCNFLQILERPPPPPPLAIDWRHLRFVR
jgi:hypothetical protein